jgi:hypothetical protein
MMLVEPDRALTRAPLLTELLECAVRALAGVDALLEPTEPPGSVGMHLEAFGVFDRLVELDTFDERDARLPVVAGDCSARIRQRVACRHDGPPIGCTRARRRTS